MIGKPRGLNPCQCGCGEDAGYAIKTNNAQGRVKGQPNRFLRGHEARLRGTSKVSRPCECGCGEIASPGRRFISGHNGRRGPEYVTEDRGYASPCWVWQRFKNPAGYGMKRYEGAARLAHRVYYMQLVGAIPEGLCLDHLCRVRACVNPDHLEPVTMRENILRGEGIAARYARRTRAAA